MTPTSQQIIFGAAAAALLGGGLAAFYGLKMVRLLLGCAGFGLGALLSHDYYLLLRPEAGPEVVMITLVGGAAGAIVLAGFYFLGMFLFGAAVGFGLAHTALHLYGGELSLWWSLGAAVLAGGGALLASNAFVIAATAFAGGWLMVYGAALIFMGGPFVTPDQFWLNTLSGLAAGQQTGVLLSMAGLLLAAGGSLSQLRYVMRKPSRPREEAK